MNIANGKNIKWNEEERRNIVGAFQILLDIDKRMNPYLYKRKKPPKSIGNLTESRLSISSENS